MKICYLCGAFVKKKGEDESGNICPKCNVHYCSRCACNASTCYICGSEPVKYVQGSVTAFDPEDIFAKIADEEKRRHPRKEYKTSIEYLFRPAGETSQPVRRAKAFTKDISESGVCIYTMVPHKEGDKLRLAKTAVLNYRTEVRPGHAGPAAAAWFGHFRSGVESKISPFRAC